MNTNVIAANRDSYARGMADGFTHGTNAATLLAVRLAGVVAREHPVGSAAWNALCAVQELLRDAPTLTPGEWDRQVSDHCDELRRRSDGKARPA